MTKGGQEHHHSQQTELDDLPSTGGSPSCAHLPVAMGTTPPEGLEDLLRQSQNLPKNAIPVMTTHLPTG